MVWILIAVFALIIYLFVIKKSQRKAAMRREVIKAIHSETGGAIETGISYKSARQHALDCGAQDNPNTDLITYKMGLEDKIYLVTVFEYPDGSSGLFVKDQVVQQRENDEMLREMHKSMGYDKKQSDALFERIRSNGG